MLPLAEPLKISSLLVSLRGDWKKTFTYSDVPNSSSIEIYQSNKERRYAWIFHQTHLESPSPEFLSSVLAILYDKGVRVVYSEVDIGLTQRIAYDTCGFEEMATNFLMTYTLEY